MEKGTAIKAQNILKEIEFLEIQLKKFLLIEKELLNNGKEKTTNQSIVTIDKYEYNPNLNNKRNETDHFVFQIDLDYDFIVNHISDKITETMDFLKEANKKLKEL